jgi:microcin C transport system permease protein
MTDRAPPAIETTRRRLLGEPVPMTRHRFSPSPLNRRRWQNFKSNRRGYWSLWIFLILFFVSLFAEFIANDKPIFIHYDGKSVFRRSSLSRDRPSAAILETAADYRDPYLQKLIADKGGTMIWPLIRFPTTPSISICRPVAAVEADLDADGMRKQGGGAAKNNFAHCGDLEYNWLGTDDQGRDVLARLIYGFRISVLFGLSLTIVSSVIGIAAGAVQGYFGGWIDLLFQRFIEIWTSMPSLYLLLILSAVLVPGFLRAARHPAAVLLGVAGRPGARRIPARPQFRICHGGARARRVQRRDHVPASAAQRHGGDHDVPAVHRVVVGDDADRARLPRLRPAAGLALARRIAVAGQGQCAGAVARLHRLFRVAIMLSLLIFIGEAVRDAFDPRKTFRYLA